MELRKPTTHLASCGPHLKAKKLALKIRSGRCRQTLLSQADQFVKPSGSSDMKYHCSQDT